MRSPTIYRNKKTKEYGTCKLAEGIDSKGKNICVIEDVVTTGGQILLNAKDLCDLGANVKHVLCVIERIYGFTRSRTTKTVYRSIISGQGKKRYPS
jgi:orotate phosphoribosyltransferase